MGAYVAALKALHDYRLINAGFDLRSAFAEDEARFSRYSLDVDGFMLDYSKCAVTPELLELLVDLAKACRLTDWREAMFSGKRINLTENRAVLHTALRRTSGAVLLDGHDIMGDVEAIFAAMTEFASGIRNGKICGHNGRKFTDIVNIGIGGSDLGPAMVTQALAPYHDGPRTHFVSNVDGSDLADNLKGLEAETTLFIIASKTFTTVETMTNAQSARKWVVNQLGEEAVSSHFAADSTAMDKVTAFGIQQDRIFSFWDWVGGRYSLWSAIGLPIMIAIGPQAFRKLLDGAAAMDQHFKTAELSQNMPVLLGLMGFWHRVICGYPTRAVIPYDQRLARLPAYLQQLDMESNGKHVTRNGQLVSMPTGPIVWGEPGTNGQHAFFQMLHQGTDIVPVEFMVAAEGHEPDMKNHHELLLANCFAQSQALMEGRSLETAYAQLVSNGFEVTEAERLAPHREFPGNRPSLTHLYKKLDPFTLGQLIALYEHRVFVEACLFGINAFDQWGVELGKELATNLLPFVSGEIKDNCQKLDSSTQGLIAKVHVLRQE